MLGLQQRLQGCGCEQGLAVLWDLAKVFLDNQSLGATGSVGEVSAQDMLQFVSDQHQLVLYKELPVRAEQGKEYRTTVKFLLGLQQLLSQPVVAAVLGWDRDQQQQRLAEVCSLYSRWLAASLGQQEQQEGMQQAGFQQQPQQQALLQHAAHHAPLSADAVRALTAALPPNSVDSDMLKSWSQLTALCYQAAAGTAHPALSNTQGQQDCQFVLAALKAWCRRGWAQLGQLLSQAYHVVHGPAAPGGRGSTQGG
jgi:hypothetical protein